MIEPPMRSSMWRFYPWSINPDVKKNTDDGGLNCGGFWRLHGINKGKCGICGDPFDAIQKQNEAGGKFYSGIIVRQYFHGDGYINVTIDVSSNIKGYFEFNICPLKGVNGTLTRKCLDKYPLLIKGNGLRYVPIADGKHNLKVKIPPNLFCKHCVLRWKWIGGNYNMSFKTFS
ncbi:hypothetical protein FSP39_014481 [Pinctada imbricata]|uniref:Chitin-binding type-4 domain-containing protein n=1 Tax=Pinctada imbricata TaxID=66713 RepID=A0AA88Y0J1_PINIB|nr:hypothetical protein FSP39_014481 [Pinctada imbricata]